MSLSKCGKGKGIAGEVSLYVDPAMDGMVNLIPFSNPRQFVYAVKLNCLPAIPFPFAAFGK